MTNLYETTRLLNEYLFFHYGEEADYLPWPGGPRAALGYAERCVTEGFEGARLGPAARALDVGCAVGRSTFALARWCGEAVGLDYSQTFVEAARRLAAEGRLEYDYVVEGKRTARGVARVPEGVEAGRVRFLQGDAMALPEELGVFDAVLAANLICRLPRPELFLRRCARLVNPGGQLVINTPFTWMEEWTPEAHWLGGKEQAESGEALRALLEPDFELREVADMPFLIREHRRKYQWSVAQSFRFLRR